MYKPVALGMILGVGLAYIIYTRQTEKSDINKLIKYTNIPRKKSGFSKQYLERVNAESRPPTRPNPSKPHISNTLPEIQPGEYNIGEHLERVNAESRPPTRPNPSKPHISNTLPEIQPGEYNIGEHLERVILFKSQG